MTCVRAAVDADLPQVVEMWSKLTGEERALGVPIAGSVEARDSWVASFRRHLGKLAFLWVAHDDQSDAMVGFLLARLRTRPPYLGAELVAEIASIYVDPAQRGRGVGESLVHTAIDALRAAGATAVETNAHTANARACAFWEASGFQTGFRSYRLPLA